MDFKSIKMMVIDVDGTLTDGGIYYDDQGDEIKKFSTRDAAGCFAASRAGIHLMVLTGRNSEATKRRMREMGIHKICQNVKEKEIFLSEYMAKNGYRKENVGYIGDDLNDLAPMNLCGFKGCPADSCWEVKQTADYISTVKGGYGAVRDVLEYLLKIRNEWEMLIQEIYGAGL